MSKQTQGDPAQEVYKFTGAELGALAHLYRGELYRSKVWRTRLDMTTNWAVGTTGVALSFAFSSSENSPVMLLMVAVLVLFFLGIEARRYRYFDIWRTRVRLLEVALYGPILRCEGASTESRWNELLERDYKKIRFHISYAEALGRRLRRNYLWILLVIHMSYFFKIFIHPTPMTNLSMLWERSSIGPIPGEVVIATTILFGVALLLLAILSTRNVRAAGRVGHYLTEDEILEFDAK